MAEVASDRATPYSLQKATYKQVASPQVLLHHCLHPKVQHQEEKTLILPKCSLLGLPFLSKERCGAEIHI